MEKKNQGRTQEGKEKGMMEEQRRKGRKNTEQINEDDRWINEGKKEGSTQRNEEYD